MGFRRKATAEVAEFIILNPSPLAEEVCHLRARRFQPLAEFCIDMLYLGDFQRIREGVLCGG